MVAIEGLETRVVPAVSTNLVFQIPADVADLGVQVGIYSNTDGNYLPSSGSSYQAIPTTGKLPLISLVSSGTYNTPITSTVILPAAAFDSGSVVMFVGTVTTGLVINSGSVATPTPASNAQDTFSICEVSYNGGAGAGSFDADVTAVDQVDFPYTMTSSASTATTPYPLTQVGITLDRSTLFSQFQAATADTAFAQCATWHIGSAAQRLTAPQDVLEAENSQQSANPITISSATIGSGGSGGLLPGSDYYYVVTAYSDHTIANGTISGETLPSAPIDSGTIPAGDTTASVQLSWSAYGSPTTAGYNIYRSVGGGGGSGSPVTYSLIGRVSGASTTTFEDKGGAPLTPLQQTTPASASNYGFNPLSDYFTNAIQQFFSYYQTHDFVLNLLTDGTEWVGRTTTIAPASSGTGATYTVLQLKNLAVPTQVVNIYEPFFSLNTRFVTNNATSPAPPMPTWMSEASPAGEGTSTYESPGQMTFACDGVFATASSDPSKTYDPNAKAQGTAVTTDLAAIENAIASAFNRGIATDFALAPNNWAAPPSLSQAPTIVPDPGSTLAAGTYYYAVTAINSNGETTPSIEVAATVTGSDQAVTLNWNRINPASFIGAVSNFNTTTPTFTLRGSLPLALQGAMPPDVYITGIPGISPVTAIPVRAVDTTSSTITVTLPSAPTGAYQGGGMVTLTSTTQANAAVAFNIYRGTSPGNLTFLAAVRNGPSTTQTSFTDDGSMKPGSWTIPYTYYPSGYPSNLYSAFLHSNSTINPTNGVSVNGLAYGYPYDDQAGLSTNVGFLNPPGSLILNIGDFQASGLKIVTPTSSLPNVGVGAPYSQTIVVSGGSGGNVFQVVGGPLPSWLSLNASTGVLNGTPAAGNVGAVNFTIQVSDSAGDKAIQPYTFNVVPFSVVTTSVSNADSGVPYNQLIGTFGGNGGNVYSLTTGSSSLPGGLTLGASTGMISGTADNVGNLGFIVSVQDAAGDTATSQAYGYNITVNPALAIPSATLPVGTVGSPYAQAIPTTGGDGAVRFTAAGLPDGLSLNVYTGALTGTPTTSGVFRFPILATDDLGDTAKQLYQLQIDPSGESTPTPLSPSTVTMQITPNIGVPGQPIVIAVTVAGSGGTPTGVVTITGLPSGPITLPLANGTAMLRVAMPLGGYVLNASYGGDASFTASVSSSTVLTQQATAVEPNFEGGVAPELVIGAITGRRRILVRRHRDRLFVQVVQFVDGGLQRFRAHYVVHRLAGLVIYGDRPHNKVTFLGGRRVPVTYMTPALPVIIGAGKLPAGR
ncbi:MAG: putative Ig domain-containing protein [Isosphaeraceae bacterium]